MTMGLLGGCAISCITDKYRPEPGIEPWASRLTYDHPTTKISRSIHFCYLNLGFSLITLVSYRVWVQAWYMYVGCYSWV